jgi:hypothetical protein
MRLRMPRIDVQGISGRWAAKSGKSASTRGRRLTNDSNAHGNGVLSAKIGQKVGLAETIGENEGISGGFTRLRQELDQ